MDEIRAHGVTVAVPRGWEAELSVVDDASEYDRSVEPEGPRVLLHAANFPLPPDRGDYGSGAVEAMDSGGVLVVLFEFDRASARTELFSAEGVPTSVSANEMSPDALQRPQRNQAGVQKFFRVGDRAFCLYVVIGSFRQRGILVREANRIIASIAVTDF